MPDAGGREVGTKGEHGRKDKGDLRRSDMNVASTWLSEERKEGRERRIKESE